MLPNAFDEEEGEPTPPMAAPLLLEGVAALLLNEGEPVLRVVVGEEGLDVVLDVLEYECCIGDEVAVANLDEEAPPCIVGKGFSDVGVEGDDADGMVMRYGVLY